MIRVKRAVISLKALSPVFSTMNSMKAAKWPIIRISFLVTIRLPPVRQGMSRKVPCNGCTSRSSRITCIHRQPHSPGRKWITEVQVTWTAAAQWCSKCLRNTWIKADFACCRAAQVNPQVAAIHTMKWKWSNSRTWNRYFSLLIIIIKVIIILKLSRT